MFPGKIRQTYTCPCCNYQSNRLYNVDRHQQRIHINKKQRICCGELLATKAEFYIHCDLHHPETRERNYISREKYKLTADCVVFDRFQQQEAEDSLNRRQEYNRQTRKKYSMRLRSSRKVQSGSTKLSFNYSLTYKGLDMENIPLIWFIQNGNLSDRQPPVLSNGCAEEIQETEETSNPPPPPEPSATSESPSELCHFDFNQEFTEGIPSVEEAKSENEQHESASEPTSPISPAALPTKKLILHRFQSSFNREFKVKLYDANNNCQEVSLTETSMESFSRLLHTATNNANKENVSSYELSYEQRLDINLDQSVNVPLTTELHRDFLGTIDFESYKIF